MYIKGRTSNQRIRKQITLYIFLVVLVYQIKQKYQKVTLQNMNPTISQPFIDCLFSCNYFVSKFTELQLQMYKDLANPSSTAQGQTQSNSLNHQSDYNQGEVYQINRKSMCELKIHERMNKCVEIESIAQEISELLLYNFKETVYKETNTVFENKLNYMTIMEEIQTLKQSINKMGQTSQFAIISGKTCATQESLTSEKEQKLQRRAKMQKLRKNLGGDASMFLDQDQSSIDLRTSRKNLGQDRLSSFSFMNSFISENKMNPHDEEIINERINASISKVQSSIEDRISQVQKQFTRRIEQIMKTIKNLIQMINENQGLTGQSIEKRQSMKKDKIQIYQSMQPNLKKSKLQGNPISSKSTVIIPHHSSRYEGEDQLQENENTNSKKLEQGLLNRSSKKLSSLFGLGKTIPISK